MTSGKPSPPSQSNYPYDTLPSTQQPPPQYYVVLPFYSSPSHRRRRQLHRCYLCSALTILLLSASLYFLWPSDPYLQVVNLRLDDLKVNTNPISIDIILGVRIKVRNPDVYSLNYKSLNISVEYRGEHLGFVTSEYGSVKAFGTSYVDATLVLNGAEVITEAVFLVQDLLRGSIPVTTSSEIRGSLGVIFLELPIAVCASDFGSMKSSKRARAFNELELNNHKPHLVIEPEHYMGSSFSDLGLWSLKNPCLTKISCEVVMNTHNQTIERQDCSPA